MAVKSININTASAQELRSTYGIGSLSAKRIVRFRESNNNKITAADLEKIPALRLSAVEKIKKPVNTAGTKPRMSRVKPAILSDSGRLKLNLSASELGSDENIEISFSNKDLISKYGTPLEDLRISKSINSKKGGLSIKIPISKHTPPGAYQTDVIAGNTTFNTTIDVVENIQVSVSPNQLMLDAKQSPQQKELIIANNGNVPVHIKSPGGVMLEVEHIDCRVIRGVVSNLRKGGANAKKDLDAVLDLASQELETLYTEAGVMRVKLNGGNCTIAPGEAKKCTFTFTVPSSLKDKSYNGALHFYGANVHINVAKS